VAPREPLAKNGKQPGMQGVGTSGRGSPLTKEDGDRASGGVYKWEERDGQW
jgi:hypothetical protein